MSALANMAGFLLIALALGRTAEFIGEETKHKIHQPLWSLVAQILLYLAAAALGLRAAIVGITA